MTSLTSALLLFLVSAGHAQDTPPPSTPPPFLPVSPAVSDELRFGALLPGFEAKDTTGRTWTNRDFRGKYTLVYIWGTGLARFTDVLDPKARGSLHGLPDLPELQRFCDRNVNSRNIQVLTFCQDYDYTHALEYMKQSGHTFPVIADWALIQKLFPVWTTEYLVINPEGRVSQPFRAWTFGRVLSEVEKAARGN